LFIAERLSDLDELILCGPDVEWRKVSGMMEKYDFTIGHGKRKNDRHPFP
jgi:hypothetical protein